jgi:hypothetical protein
MDFDWNIARNYLSTEFKSLKANNINDVNSLNNPSNFRSMINQDDEVFECKVEENFLQNPPQNPPQETQIENLLENSPENNLPVKILIFTWNTESVRLAETLSVDEMNSNREGNFPTYWLKSEIPDFYPHLAEKIKSSHPDIVVLATQEDAYPGSYFHSHLLPEEMPKIGYSLIKRTKMIGFGKTTYNALLEYDLKARGLRTSIYAHIGIASNIRACESSLEKDIGSTQKNHLCSPIYVRGKGGVVSYIRLAFYNQKTRHELWSNPPAVFYYSRPQYLTFAFINAHLPFNADGLVESYVKHDPLIRHNDVQFQNICFNNIYKDFISNLSFKPDCVFYFGDFNYRLKQFNDAETIASVLENSYQISMRNPAYDSKEIYRTYYQEYDELLDQMKKGNIYHFNEGISNQGPLFLPTCKLNKHRSSVIGSFKPGDHNQRPPSWADRILYKFDSKEISCSSYERFDYGNTMKLSDHAAVVGVFEVNSV